MIFKDGRVQYINVKEALRHLGLSLIYRSFYRNMSFATSQMKHTFTCKYGTDGIALDIYTTWLGSAEQMITYECKNGTSWLSKEPCLRQPNFNPICMIGSHRVPQFSLQIAYVTYNQYGRVNKYPLNKNTWNSFGLNNDVNKDIIQVTPRYNDALVWKEYMKTLVISSSGFGHRSLYQYNLMTIVPIKKTYFFNYFLFSLQHMGYVLNWPISV